MSATGPYSNNGHGNAPAAGAGSGIGSGIGNALPPMLPPISQVTSAPMAMVSGGVSNPNPNSNSNADAATSSTQQHQQQYMQHQQQPPPQSSATPPAGSAAPRSSAPPLDQMRAYRACLNCRNRKSKCDLDINNGRPPCRRCQREARDCVLGESHRGGRRVRKKPKLEDAAPTTPTSSTHSHTSQGFPTPAPAAPFQAPGVDYHQHQQPPQAFHNKYDTRNESGLAWQQQQGSNTATSPATSSHRNTDQGNIHSQLTSPNTTGSPYQQRQPSNASSSKRVNDNIASADLQNPSDALEILAHVADRADDGDSERSSDPAITNTPQEKKIRIAPQRPNPTPPEMADYFHYQPLLRRQIGPETIYHLFSSYEEYFHPYFPIIPRETFDRTRLTWLSRAEPHLFSAILTIASKDTEPIHQVCYEHMQQLVSNILAGAEADVEAVEALLLLSQWVSHRPQQQIAVGRGEEDRVAWMYIGTALRLGYFLGIDRTSFKSSSDSSEPPARFNRKRLVWAACYICDRQVSVRLGKGFWSRGPGPLSGLKSSDFPALQPMSPNEDNWALIFQANLELTQIFSNVHDILYASKGHGWKEMLEGRYAKYLDDFRTSIRSWNDVWGTLVCSPRLKASLLLTYDYLRLYVNAFAYQATISRALIYQRDSQHNANRPVPLINSTAPDARFIYEALDAAKSLLSTFNNFVDPETLRYMPSSYYLFIIYSAVFLYKARSTTTMTEDERTGVRRMINQTIDRLQKASVGANHMGSRYSRLIQMLWRKSPKANNDATRHQSIDGRLKAPENEPPTSIPNVYDQNAAFNMGMNNMAQTNAPNGTFSWLDLGATWNFATQNNTTSVSGGSSGEMDDMMGVDTGLSPFDMSLLTDYRLLDGDNPNFIF